MEHVDGLSRKSYAPQDKGVIKDILDEHWLPLIKEKVLASLASERPKWVIRKPKRYETDTDTDTKAESKQRSKQRRYQQISLKEI